MIVCVCRAISDRVIKSVIAAGADSVAEVGQACRAGTCCGACRPAILHMLRDTRAQPQQCTEPCHASACDRQAA